MNVSIIVLLGPVGVGKSTQRNKLFDVFRSEKLKVKSTQLKALHFLSKFLIDFLGALLRKKHFQNQYRLVRDEKNVIVSKAFPFIALFDVPSFVLRYWFTVALPVKLGYVVIVEEFLFGTLAEYLYIVKKIGKNNVVSRFFILFIKKLLVKNQDHVLTLYLDAPKDVLNKRIVSRNTYSEDNDYINMQQSFLLYIAKTFTRSELFFCIDTNNSDVNNVSAEIKNILCDKGFLHHE